MKASRSRKRARRAKDAEDDDVTASSLGALYQAAAGTSSGGMHESEESLSTDLKTVELNNRLLSRNDITDLALKLGSTDRHGYFPSS